MTYRTYSFHALFWQVTPSHLPNAPIPSTISLFGNSHQKGGGWGTQRRAKKVGREGGHGLSRAEVEIRLERVEMGEQGVAGLPV
jgi:hypothetical protein